MALANANPAGATAGLGKQIVPRQNGFRVITGQPTTEAPVIGDIDDNNICRIGEHVTTGRTPILTACRELLAQGIGPDRALEIYRRGVLAVRVRSIGRGAKLTVREDRGAPEFSPHRTGFALDGASPRAAIEHQAGAEVFA